MKREKHYNSILNGTAPLRNCLLFSVVFYPFSSLYSRLVPIQTLFSPTSDLPPWEQPELSPPAHPARVFAVRVRRDAAAVRYGDVGADAAGTRLQRRDRVHADVRRAARQGELRRRRRRKGHDEEVRSCCCIRLKETGHALVYYYYYFTL